MIYNGRNTKILQRYKDYLSGGRSTKIKVPKMVADTNRIIVFMWVIMIIEAILSLIISISRQKQIESEKLLDDFLGLTLISRLADLMLTYSWGVPLISFFVVDIATFIYGYKIEKAFKGSDPFDDNSSGMVTKKGSGTVSSGSNPIVFIHKIRDSRISQFYPKVQ